MFCTALYCSLSLRALVSQLDGDSRHSVLGRIRTYVAAFGGPCLDPLGYEDRFSPPTLNRRTTRAKHYYRIFIIAMPETKSFTTKTTIGVLKTTMRPLRGLCLKCSLSQIEDDLSLTLITSNNKNTGFIHDCETGGPKTRLTAHTVLA